MAVKKRIRDRLFVDFKLQWAIAFRIILYWLTCQFMIAVYLYAWQRISGGDRPTDMVGLFFRCALWGSLAFLFLAVGDVIRQINRYVRPILQLQRVIRDLSCSMQAEPIQLDEADSWKDLTRDLNVLVNRIQRQNCNKEPEVSFDTTPESTPQLLQAAT